MCYMTLGFLFIVSQVSMLACQEVKKTFDLPWCIHTLYMLAAHSVCMSALGGRDQHKNFMMTFDVQEGVGINYLRMSKKE